MLQNEAADADDDLEHFEDIDENDENQAIPVQDNGDKKSPVADISNGSDSDGDSSNDDEGGSATSGSDRDSFDEGDDLLGEGGFDKLEELKIASDHKMQNLHEGLALPGGYNPRHREPSYW